LEQREAGHRLREAADRSELADRLAVDLTPDGERMRRYHLDCDRKLHRAIQSLLKLRRAEGIGIADDPIPDGTPEPDPAPLGTVEGRSGPEREAGAEVQPMTEGQSPEDEDPVGGGLPSSTDIDLSFMPEPEVLSAALVVATAQAAASAGVIAPDRRAAEPESHQAPLNEPATPSDGQRIMQNEPGPLSADRTPQNEPGTRIGRDSALPNAPGRSGRIAGRGVPALVCVLFSLLAVGLLLVHRPGTSVVQVIATDEPLGQARHLLAGGGVVVDVSVAPAVADSFHQGSDRVTKRWWVSRTGF
jgi:hypothetical protein